MHHEERTERLKNIIFFLLYIKKNICLFWVAIIDACLAVVNKDLESICVVFFILSGLKISELGKISRMEKLLGIENIFYNIQ